MEVAFMYTYVWSGLCTHICDTFVLVMSTEINMYVHVCIHRSSPIYRPYKTVRSVKTTTVLC